MNENRSDHDRINPRLDEFVDGELSATGRREVEAHLEGCAACRSDLVARRHLLDEAGALPRSIEPERDLWPDIRPRLGRQPRLHRLSRPALAAATVALVAGAAALALWLSADGGPAGAPRSADGTGAGGGGGPSVVTLVTDWRALEDEYGGAAEELQQTLHEIGDELAPETRRIVEENLRVIDEAIAESREALERDPANRELERTLRAAWSSKVEMLQYVTRL